jgi:dephospho-CoA kinase
VVKITTFSAKRPEAANIDSNSENSQQLLLKTRSNELFVAVVGPAGAGAGTAAAILKSYLAQTEVAGSTFQVEIIKASDAIKVWARQSGLSVPANGQRKSILGMIEMQDRGDQMRLEAQDNAAVVRAAISQIRQRRSRLSKRALGEIDGRPRAYIIDSLRHPAEAHLLRRLYQDAFALVGVVCDPEERRRRLRSALFDPKDWHNQK